jgi:hypothetical protein
MNDAEHNEAERPAFAHLGATACNMMVVGQVLYRPSPDTIARIAEFLSLISTLSDVTPRDIENVRQQIRGVHMQLSALEAQEREMVAAREAAAPAYRRVNELALCLAMELPPGMYRAVTRSTQPGGNAYSAVDVVRDALGMEAIPATDPFWAAPGIGRQQ